jgi:hypothetical protein
MEEYVLKCRVSQQKFKEKNINKITSENDG